MNVDRSILEDYLSKKFFNILINKSEELEIYNYAYEKYNYPKGIFSDFLSSRKSIEEANDYTLFVIADSILNATKKDYRKKLSDFFTDREISKYSGMRYEEPNKIEFPLVFNMIQVSDDQWIGSLNVDTFCALQESGLINYNPVTQRAMTKITRDNNELYRITLNKNAVKEITADMLEHIYVPDTITLNIPKDDIYADFHYDEQSRQLIIHSLEAFDINDGYHRYVSMFQARSKNPNFNYPMELRITNFDIDKSRRMIYQYDQKTKMSKQLSDTYNSYAAQNKVVQRINESSMCNLQGEIKIGGLIDSTTLAECIKRLYFSKRQSDSPEQRKEIIRVSKEFIEDLNMLTEEDDKYLEKEYSKKEIIILTILFHYYDGKNKISMIENYKCFLIDDAEREEKIIYDFSRNFNRIRKRLIPFLEERM